ncbi:MAG: pilus assembly protein TadG-related protein [Alphaproteobacteria bacterium]
MLLKNCFRSNRGNVSVIFAIALPVIIGAAGLAVEFSQAKLFQSQNQRVADLAAYAAALNYSSSQSITSAGQAASSVLSLNNLSGAVANTTLVTSPSGSGNSAISVKISRQQSFALAQNLFGRTSLNITATSIAEVASSSGCITALDPSGAGIKLNGGTRLNAPDCTIASNSAVDAPCGTAIVTAKLDYGSDTPPSNPCNNITPPAGKAAVTMTKVITTDPHAGDIAIANAAARLTQVNQLATPATASVSTGGDIDFGLAPSMTMAQAAADGCVASWDGGTTTWTLTCSGLSSYNFGFLAVGGGMHLNFNTGAPATTTYNFKGPIIVHSATANFAAGNYNMSKGIVNSGSAQTSFGAGIFSIGPAQLSGGICGAGVAYSICNSSRLQFAGPSVFKIATGIFNGGGSTLVLGSGVGNSFQVGAASNGNALYGGGGAYTLFGDATGNGNVFQMAGNFNVSSGGGSCAILGAAAQHDIKGYVSSAGGTLLGAGAYTVKDYVAFGANNGGDANCDGVSVGVYGVDVTLVIGGASAPTTGSCSGNALCLAQGYRNVSITAPTSGATKGLVVIGPQTASNHRGANFTDGAENTALSGTLYFPNGPISLSGGASLGGGSGQCLEIIGSEISMAGGSTAASNCSSIGGYSQPTVRLVQ